MAEQHKNSDLYQELQNLVLAKLLIFVLKRQWQNSTKNRFYDEIFVKPSNENSDRSRQTLNFCAILPSEQNSTKNQILIKICCSSNENSVRSAQTLNFCAKTPVAEQHKKSDIDQDLLRAE